MIQRDDSSIYTRLSCCILTEQYNKLQVLMHIVRENIHGTAPARLPFKDDRIKPESERCIAVPVPSWFSKATKIFFSLVCRWPCILVFSSLSFCVGCFLQWFWNRSHLEQSPGLDFSRFLRFILKKSKLSTYKLAERGIWNWVAFF